MFLACGVGAEGFSGDRVAGHTAGGGVIGVMGVMGVMGLMGLMGLMGDMG